MINPALMTVFVALAVSATSAKANPCDTSLGIELPANCENIAISHPIEGLHNFRELTTPDGGIKAGKLFRSDQLDQLTEGDIEILIDLGVTTVIDLRAHEELESHPNKKIPTVTFEANLPIGSDPADVAKIMPLEVASQIRPMWFEGKFHEIDQLLEDYDVDLKQIRIDRYQDFARNFNPQISRYMQALTNSDNFPLLFHCAGGKDRTGYVAAVTLLTLGYGKDDVLRDYLSTNIFTHEELVGLYSKGPQSLRPSFGAHSEQIKASLQAIENDHGDFETYRRDILKITDEQVEVIKANLLK